MLVRLLLAVFGCVCELHYGVKMNLPTKPFKRGYKFNNWRKGTQLFGEEWRCHLDNWEGKPRENNQNHSQAKGVNKSPTSLDGAVMGSTLPPPHQENSNGLIAYCLAVSSSSHRVAVPSVFRCFWHTATCIVKGKAFATWSNKKSPILINFAPNTTEIHLIGSSPSGKGVAGAELM